ncbi:hypothetical protein B0H19DRAFT_1260716 [Mycena capillaripes]|nr:hypothetical protein B0H19DRAFT_1260716 [Mycena capillaripes]
MPMEGRSDATEGLFSLLLQSSHRRTLQSSIFGSYTLNDLFSSRSAQKTLQRQNDGTVTSTRSPLTLSLPPAILPHTHQTLALLSNPLLTSSATPSLRNDRAPEFIRPFVSCKSAKIMLHPVTGDWWSIAGCEEDGWPSLAHTTRRIVDGENSRDVLRTFC